MKPWRGSASVIIHVAVVALLLFVGSLKPVQKAVKEFVPIFAPDLKPLQPKPKPEQSKGGGGSPQKTGGNQGRASQGCAQVIYSSDSPAGRS